MQILTDTDENIQKVADIILSGGVVVHATETCYGLACDLSNVEAIEKLFKIKDRPFDQPVSALFPSVEEAKEWVEWCEKAEELAKKWLPGPLTIVLRREKRKVIYTLPTSDLSHQQTIGIRVSPHPIAIKLCTLVGYPIATTSANVHGRPNPYSVQEILDQYENQELKPDLVLDSGKLPQNTSSRVVGIKNGKVVVYRE